MSQAIGDILPLASGAAPGPKPIIEIVLRPGTPQAASSCARAVSESR